MQKEEISESVRSELLDRWRASNHPGLSLILPISAREALERALEEAQTSRPLMAPVRPANASLQP